MLPVGPLMVEHRLIERMIALMGKEVSDISQGRAPDTEFVRKAVDFIKTYADRLHHGKEEDILFRDLAQKPLSAAHKRIMEELIHEHALGREHTGKLVEARDRYLKGDAAAKDAMCHEMGILAEFYPKHIEKEDKHFFLPVMNYFSQDEQAKMLKEFDEVDRLSIHAVYRDMVAGLEKR